MVINNISIGVTAIIGLAVGFGIGYFFGKKKYQAIEEDSVSSVKKAFRDKCEWCEHSSNKYAANIKSVPDPENNPDKSEDKDKVSEQKIEYYKLAEKYKAKGDEENMNNNIYVISPEVFGDSGYEEMSLTLYSNNVLVDDIRGTVIKKPEKLVGTDYMDHFGNDDDPDRVCIRNDEKKLDIEILFDMDEYEE